jgi:hypothetical protein
MIHKDNEKVFAIHVSSNLSYMVWCGVVLCVLGQSGWPQKDFDAVLHQLLMG